MEASHVECHLHTAKVVSCIVILIFIDILLCIVIRRLCRRFTLAPGAPKPGDEMQSSLGGSTV